MVYVGGTDPGCFIPTMLNETTDGEQHIVFTQNALADSSYIDYVNFLYGDQVNILTADDNKSAFDQYSADAKKRLEHDQQFPDEPKQILPGEDLQMVNGSLIIHGVTAVMAINEVLLQDFLQKNPDLSVAMEESYPLKSTYAGAAPLGPIMELGANDGASAITADTAAQTAGYWDSAAQNLLSNPEAAASDTVLKTYSHEAVAAGNLLANNNYSDAAEQTYQTALDLWPDNPEAAYTFARFLAGQGRMDEAREILDTIVTDDPVQAAAVEAVRGTLKAAPGQPSRAVP
jgi:tetratricopeptide (TPR) repeat protein